MYQMGEKAAELFDVKHAIPVTSGTAALHCAYIAADICQGAEVIVPGYTFMATAMAVVVTGGIPVWCEVDESMTIDPEDVEKRITPRTKAIAPVHMSGYICDMDAVMDIAKRHNLLVIEDCAQSCGDYFKGKRVGTIGDMGCFSISSYKTTGGSEGGMFVTNNEKFYHRAIQWAEAGGLWRPDRYALPRRTTRCQKGRQTESAVSSVGSTTSGFLEPMVNDGSANGITKDVHRSALPVEKPVDCQNHGDTLSG